MSNQGEYPEDNRVGKHEPHDFSLTRRDLIKVSRDITKGVQTHVTIYCDMSGMLYYKATLCTLA